jgi:L-aminopeptidase/D-esterase-like protein
MNQTITAVPGVRVGHHTDNVALTGVTVVDFPEPNTAAAEIRGGAPGTREYGLLQPGMTVQSIQSIVLAGGSAFGLAAADGVVKELEKAGRGFPTLSGPIPIVPAAIIFDLAVGDSNVRPGPGEGANAFRALSSAPAAQGGVGAGTGATVAKWRGSQHVRPGGIGSFSLQVGEATVGALVVANALGDVFTLEGDALTGGLHASGPPATPPIPGEQTTLVVLATDAAATRVELSRLIVRAHDALGATLRPAHTRFDGDIVFAVSCGQIEADLDALGEAAFQAVGRSVERAITER